MGVLIGDSLLACDLALIEEELTPLGRRLVFGILNYSFESTLAR